jgi:GTPase SAR1 family protein
MPLNKETKDTKIDKLDRRLFSHPFRAVVVASSGGGKSSFIYSMIKDKSMYGKFFDKILIWNGSPRYNEQYEKIDNAEVYNNFNQEEIKEIVDEIRDLQAQRKNEGLRYYRILFIFDDYSSKGLVSRNAVNIIDDIFCSGRNAGISIMITAQVYNHINRNCRMTNLTHLVLLGVNKTMLEEVADEHQSELATPEDIISIYKDIRKHDKYGALIVDYIRPNEERFRTLNKIYKIENGNH